MLLLKRMHKQNSGLLLLYAWDCCTSVLHSKVIAKMNAFRKYWAYDCINGTWIKMHELCEFWYYFAAVKCSPLFISNFSILSPHFLQRHARETKPSSGIQPNTGWFVNIKMILLWEKYSPTSKPIITMMKVISHGSLFRGFLLIYASLLFKMFLSKHGAKWAGVT